ncbi:hypothetical protein Lal_00036658 [Lupinus albus]|nr:hypothetical protein Lal_00036658 [Lupinus albus]
MHVCLRIILKLNRIGNVDYHVNEGFEEEAHLGSLCNLGPYNKIPKECFSCHECGKSGHMKFQCLRYLKKFENDKNASREFKSKKAYIVWDVPEEESTSSTSEEEETTKLCLMVNTLDPSTPDDHGESNEVHSYESSSCSENSPS